MDDITDEPSLLKLQNQECPDCGDRLLLGPRGGASRNLTCRNGKCQMKFNACGFVTGTVFLAQRLGPDPVQAAFHNPDLPVRQCHHCGQDYQGPGFYCSLGCGLDTDTLPRRML